MPSCARVDFQTSHQYFKLEVGLRACSLALPISNVFPFWEKKNPVSFKVYNLISVTWVCLKGALHLERCRCRRAGRGLGHLFKG